MKSFIPYLILLVMFIINLLFNINFFVLFIIWTIIVIGGAFIKLAKL